MFRGFAVGVTETVPGVSGSTVAMVLGIYERLIESLSLLTTKERRKAYPFLVIFGIGMVIGFGCSLFLIDFLLTSYRMPTLVFFIGIIVGFIPFLWNETVVRTEGKLTFHHYCIVLVFISLVVFLQSFTGIGHIDVQNLTFTHYFLFLGAGFLASTALVLPGISGALILTILGLYELAKDALLSIHIPIVLSIGSGVVLGVLISSKFIRFLLENYQAETYCAMVGLVTGSIYAIAQNIHLKPSISMFFLSLLTLILGIGVSLRLMQR